MVASAPDREHQVAHGAVHPDGHRGLRQPRPDRLGDRAPGDPGGISRTLPSGRVSRTWPVAVVLVIAGPPTARMHDRFGARAQPEVQGDPEQR